jgi:hypothetical protein
MVRKMEMKVSTETKRRANDHPLFQNPPIPSALMGHGVRTYLYIIRAEKGR